MIRRRVLILAALLIPPGAGTAQTTPARTAPPRRRVARPIPPPPPAPPPAPVSRGEPAPVPNPDIEAPRNRDAPSARIDPALIDPNVPSAGVSGPPQGPPAQEDRLLRQPGAGARLRVPFAY